MNNVLFSVVFALLTAGSAAGLSIEASPAGMKCDVGNEELQLCRPQFPIAKLYSFSSDLTPEIGEGDRRVRKLCAYTEDPEFLGFTNVINPTDGVKCRKVAIPAHKADDERTATFKFRMPKGAGEIFADGGRNCVRTLSLGLYKPLDPANEKGYWVETGTIHDYVTIGGASCYNDIVGEQTLATVWVALKYIEDYLKGHGVYPPAPIEGVVVNSKCLDDSGFDTNCEWDNPHTLSLGLPNPERAVLYLNDVNGCRLVVETTAPLPNHGLAPGVHEFQCDYLKQTICNE